MIFFDNASTTKPSEECLHAAEYYQKDLFFNPSAPYHPSVQAAMDLADYREKILKNLRGNGKIVFTSSGTESDNLALFGSKKANGSRIVVSNAEHPAVARCADELKNKGYDVVFAPVDKTGKVIADDFANLITPETSLVSVMHVNNETGAINDVKELCKMAKSKNPSVLFHSDGVQAVGKVAVNLTDLGVDLYSFSGHKIHALRGVGGLFIKNGVHLRPILFGGGQEFAIRSSTENLAGIAALSKAVEVMTKAQKEHYERISAVNDYLRTKLAEQGDAYRIVSGADASPYILNFSLQFVRGEVMLHSLEKYDIYVGTGSACSSKKSERSVAKYADLPKEYEKGVLRVSLDENTTKEEVDYFIYQLNLEYNQLVKYMRG